MFSREPDASKVALVHLVARLKVGGFRLLDAQFTTKHLKQFGAIEVDRARYHQLLDAALSVEGDFYRWAGGVTGEETLHSVSQTS
jgi:leucyl/phenylalanyl-tRNA--protein transferase